MTIYFGVYENQIHHFTIDFDLRYVRVHPAAFGESVLAMVNLECATQISIPPWIQVGW